jgi:predicted CXXCH cytochrome family protein
VRSIAEPEPAAPGNWNTTLTAEYLKPLLSSPRAGFWHFEQVHKTVVERGYECTRCHSPQLPFAPLSTRQQRVAQIELCVNCH